MFESYPKQYPTRLCTGTFWKVSHALDAQAIAQYNNMTRDGGAFQQSLMFDKILSRNTVAVSLMRFALDDTVRVP